MIINRGGRLYGPQGLPLPQQQPQANVMQQPAPLPPNLLAGGATTNPPQRPMTPAPPRPPMIGMQPMGGGGQNAPGGPIMNRPLNPTSPNQPIGMQPYSLSGAQRPYSTPIGMQPQMPQPQQPQNSMGGAPINLTPGPSPSTGVGLGNPFLFNPANPTGGSMGGSAGATTGGSLQRQGGGAGGGGAAGGGRVIGGNQYNPSNIAGQLQAARDAANAKNEQRYNQQLDLNQSGQQTQLGEQNASYSALGAMPGQNAARQQQIIQQARQDQLGAINSSQQKLDAQAQAAGASQGKAAQNAYGSLLSQADTRAGKTQNFVDSAYGNLKSTAAQGGANSMGFLNQQNAGMQALLNSYSNADYAREKRQTQDQLGQIALDMADRGLSSDTLDQSLKRGVYDDSALRQGEISDRRLGRSLDVANSYTGRGLGVLGDTNQQQFAAGSAYANAGLNARQNADSQALNIAGRGVDTSLDAQRSADAARLNLGQSFANQDINTRGDLNRAGLNVAADQGAREQSLAGQYAGQRQNTLENSNNQRIGIIGARTDQGPSEGDYFGLLSQAGASGRGGGYVGGTAYNPQGGGHIAGGGGGGFMGGQYQAGGFGAGGGTSVGNNSSIGSQGYPRSFGGSATPQNNPNLLPADVNPGDFYGVSGEGGNPWYQSGMSAPQSVPPPAGPWAQNPQYGSPWDEYYYNF